MKTVVARLNGGLGNQLFQFAAAECIAKRQERELFVDTSGIFNSNTRGLATKRSFELQSAISIQPHLLDPGLGGWRIKALAREGLSASSTFLSRIVSSLPSKDWQVLREGPDGYENLIAAKDAKNLYLIGYWQDFRFAEEVRSQLTRKLMTPYMIGNRGASLLESIESQNSVAVHVRRGDFLTKWGQNHQVTSREFFNSAIKEMQRRVRDPKFFVFSDDADWCRMNLSQLPEGSQIISPSFHESSYSDMWLMSRARNFILSNSSFSWWAAWSAQRNAETILRPVRWLKSSGADARVFPPHWEAWGNE